MKTLLTATALAALATVAAAQEDCGWAPERAVTYIVPWGAGGGTDAHSRALAAMMEERLGVPFNVVNRTGGNGVTGHSAIATADPDGYTVGAATVEITMMHHAGLTEMTPADFTPLALLDVGPASVVVKADSQFETLEDLIAHAEENPGELTGSGTSQGGIWHLALAGMLQSHGLEPDAIRWIPSQGAAPAMQELLAGGVDVVTPALSEAKAIIESGEARGLAFMNAERNEALPDVPTVEEATGTAHTLASFISFAGPAGLPEEVACAYGEAAAEVLASEEWAEFKASRGAPVVSEDREALAARYEETSTMMGETMSAIGLTQ
jgi:tripartite-type tricarboxylate transporter receptor subunit TctC